MSTIFLSLVLLSSFATNAFQKAERWNTYANARFNYSISYPSSLAAQGESANGDGQVFRSGDGAAELRVWGSNNALNQTLEAAYQEAITDLEQHGGSVSYKLLRGNFFVVSGRQGNTIVYQKTLLRGDVFKAFTFTYPAGAKSTYDSITTRIANSFKG